MNNTQPYEDLESLFTMRPLQGCLSHNPIQAQLHGIIYIYNGSGRINIDGNHLVFSPTDLLLIGKGQMYSFPDATTAEGCLLWFADSFWLNTPGSSRDCKSSLFNHVRQNQQLHPSHGEARVIRSLLQIMQDEFDSDDYSNKPDALAAFLKVLVIKIANINSLLSEDTNNYNYKTSQQYLNLINTNYTQWHEVATYAEKLGITARKLGEICRTCHDKGAKELIIEKLLESSQRMLQFSGRPVKDIAFTQGFSSAYQFSAFFKKHAGLSPFAYRRRFVKISKG